MHTLGKRTILPIILIIVLAAVLRVVVLQLNKLNCGEPQFKQFQFACEMGFFLIPVLFIASFLGAVVPFVTLADRRDQIARVWQFLLIPSVINTLLRGVDYMLFDCEGDGFVANEMECDVLFIQLAYLSFPTLAAIIFVWFEGWKHLFLQEKEGT